MSLQVRQIPLHLLYPWLGHLEGAYIALLPQNLKIGIMISFHSHNNMMGNACNFIFWKHFDPLS